MSDRLVRTRTEPRRYFIVPEETLVPTSGDADATLLELRTLDGAAVHLAEVDLAPFEVDAARAAAHVDAGVERMLEPLRTTFRDWFGASEEPAEGIGQNFAKWLGVTPGEVMVDRDKRRHGRRTLLEKAGRLFSSEVSDERLDQVEATLDRLGEAVVRDGERLRDTLDSSRPAVEAAVEDLGQNLTAAAELARAELEKLGVPLPARRDPEEEP
ncbi:MAG: hypothetical protein ABMA64_04440 [Myxococcota bacterium]